MDRQWVVVGHWKRDPAVWVQQVYGPFASQAAAKRWIKAHRDPQWRWQAFGLLLADEVEFARTPKD
jgi:hypothetical protein